MIAIRYSNIEIIKILGGFQLKKKDRKYRFNRYIIHYKYNNEDILVYNLITGSLVLMKKYELNNVFTDLPCNYAEYFLSNYFIVPEEYDEDFYIEEIRNKYKRTINRTYLDHARTFTIITTSKCNANCYYCYENSVKDKHHMTINTAKNVAKYIIENHDINSSLALNWFGGEPLYNSKVIDIITNILSSANIKFYSQITSNGYLFNEKIINKCVNEWNVNNIQITLDGVEEKYNKVKKYIYKDNNPFKVVINNIKALIDKKISLSIRMNCGENNFEDIKELAHYLGKEFKDNPNKIYLRCYAALIEDKNSFNLSEEKAKILYKNLLEIQKILLNYNIFDINLEYGVKYLHCLVDSEEGVIINTDGNLGLCENYIDSHFIGNINTPGYLNLDNIKSQIQYYDYEEICNDCDVKPLCLRIKICNYSKKCNQYIKSYLYEMIIIKMINTYHKFLLNQQIDNCNCNNCNCNSFCKHQIIN